jgi:hypothetical protein
MLAVAGEVLTLMAQIQVQLQVLVEMAEVVREEKLQQGLTERQTLVVAPAPAVAIQQMVEVSVARGLSSYVYQPFTQPLFQVD